MATEHPMNKDFPVCGSSLRLAGEGNARRVLSGVDGR